MKNNCAAHAARFIVVLYKKKKSFDWINAPVYIFLEREKLFQK